MGNVLCGANDGRKNTLDNAYGRADGPIKDKNFVAQLCALDSLRLACACHGHAMPPAHSATVIPQTHSCIPQNSILIVERAEVFLHPKCSGALRTSGRAARSRCAEPRINHAFLGRVTRLGTSPHLICAFVCPSPNTTWGVDKAWNRPTHILYWCLDR